MKKARLWIGFLVLLLILIRPQASVNGARRAMAVWCGSVAPTLFPFFALMPLITGPEACSVYNYAFSSIMNRLFYLPGSAAAAVMIALIAGSPAGAIAIRRVGESSSLSKREIRRLACCLCGVSPAFLIMGVGQGMYGSVRLGFALAGMQLAIQLGMLFASRGNAKKSAAPAISSINDTQFNIALAVESILCVCGYMVLFGSVASVIADLTGKTVGLAVLLLGDLPTGLAELAKLDIPGRFLIQGGAIGFGGLCISMQNMDVLHPAGVKWGDYFAAHGISAGLFAALSGVFLQRETTLQLIRNTFSANIYVISLFLAAFFTLPAMIYFSNQQFLNKRKLEESSG